MRLLILFILFFSITNIYTQDIWDNSYPWSGELIFKLFNQNGKVILPENCGSDQLDMYVVLPEVVGNQQLFFNSTTQFYHYTQNSDAEEDMGILFTYKGDTMSWILPNFPHILSIDSLPFKKGQFFISGHQFQSALQSNDDTSFSYFNSDYYQLKIKDWEALRFNNNNFKEKEFQNDLDDMYYEGYYKSHYLDLLSDLILYTDSVSSQICFLKNIETIPSQGLLYFTQKDNGIFLHVDSMIIDHQKALEKILGEEAKHIDIDFSKEIILNTRVGGDCHMRVRNEFIKDVATQTITWKIYNHWGGCRAGGRVSLWVKIPKPDNGYKIVQEIKLMD